MTPPPPPPPGVGHVGPAPPMPASLQVMMREMQQRQLKFQQQQQMQQSLMYQGGRRGGRGGRHIGRGRGRGRKGFQHQNYRRNQSDDQLQSKRKRRPSDEVRDASRFFLPSFLEDPWKAFEGGNGIDRKQGDLQWKEEMHPRQVRHSATDNGLGRVLFQPSFLNDPWVR